MPDTASEISALVFISYSSNDAQAASDLRNKLESSYYPCFLAHDDVPATEDWHDEIWKTLHKCHAFVGLVTEDFNSSAFCQQEIGAALALGKPSLLVFAGARKVAGFAARFQAVKSTKLLETLNELPKFRQLRAGAWIHATKKADSYATANADYTHFRKEWPLMAEDEQLRWLLAAAGNPQVYGEGYHVGPFFKRIRDAMKPRLTNQWLFENDKDGVLHDFDSNPVGLKKKRKEKRKK
jgi:TIR domain